MNDYSTFTDAELASEFARISAARADAEKSRQHHTDCARALSERLEALDTAIAPVEAELRARLNAKVG